VTVFWENNTRFVVGLIGMVSLEFAVVTVSTLTI